MLYDGDLTMITYFETESLNYAFILSPALTNGGQTNFQHSIQHYFQKLKSVLLRNRYRFIDGRILCQTNLLIHSACSLWIHNCYD